MSSRPLVVFVLGPERSATRLVTRLLIRAGCSGTATAEPRKEFGGFPQEFDANVPPASASPAVLRRTLPYHPDRMWPDLENLRAQWMNAGFRIASVVCNRRRIAIVRSQVAAKIVGSTEIAVKEVDRAYAEILGFVSRHTDAPAFILPFTELVRDPGEVFGSLCGAIGLRPPVDPGEEIIDPDEKHLRP